MIDISTEIAEIQNASTGEEIRQPIIDILTRINRDGLPVVSASDAGSFLGVNSSGEWGVFKNESIMPVPTSSMIISLNGTYDVTNYASAIVSISGGGTNMPIRLDVTQPTKNTYSKGDILDLSGTTVTLVYNDGTTQDVTSSCSFYPADGTTLSFAGTYTIKASYIVKGNLPDGKYTATIKGSTNITVSGEALPIVSWSSGSNTNVANMIQAAHFGIIDLQNDGGWSVGDVRSISISAFTGGGSVSSRAQTIDIVITSFDDYNDCGCVMQFDFKDALSANMRMNATDTNVGGYGASEMFTTTLPALVNALPSWLSNILIEFSVLVSAGDQSSLIETVTGNKLAFRSEVEVFGDITYSYSGEGSLIPYYTTAANRKKKIGHSGSYSYWWERSPRSGHNGRFCSIDADGNVYANNSSGARGVAPFGCV